MSIERRRKSDPPAGRLTLEFVLDQIRKMGKEDGLLDHEANILNILDSLAVIGVDGAQDLYMKTIIGKSKKHIP